MTSISDMFPSFFFIGHRRKVLLLFICVVCFCGGLTMVTEVRPRQNLSVYFCPSLCATLEQTCQSPRPCRLIHCREDFMCFCCLITTLAVGFQYYVCLFCKSSLWHGCLVSKKNRSCSDQRRLHSQKTQKVHR